MRMCFFIGLARDSSPGAVPTAMTLDASPKGTNSIAVGATHGSSHKRSIDPEGVGFKSTNNVVVRNAVILKKLDKFFLESPLSMMLFLTSNILLQFTNI